MKALIRAGAIPEDSMIQKKRYKDFSDCFSMHLTRNDVTIDDIVNCFFTSAPPFVIRLMQLRDFMVRAFGLKTSSHATMKKVVFKPGNKIGLFKMYTVNKQEAIIGADDKHLDFRTSLYVMPANDDSVNVLISTAVLFNNYLGRVYMKIVGPVHKIVVRAMMKNMYKSLMALPARNNMCNIA